LAGETETIGGRWSCNKYAFHLAGNPDHSLDAGIFKGCALKVHYVHRIGQVAALITT